MYRQTKRTIAYVLFLLEFKLNKSDKKRHDLYLSACTAVPYSMSETLQCHQKSLEETPDIRGACSPQVYCRGSKGNGTANFRHCGGCAGHPGHLLRCQRALLHRSFTGMGEECLVNLKSHLSQLETKCKKA